jgi:ubiquinone/menaquinone biosynthesis C-methylase UbiE
MIAICRERFPVMDFRLCDARNLSMFSDNSFDVVFFSFNGIDYVGHAGRLAILAEVHRVLRPDGVFWFSTHNRDVKSESLWRTKFVWSLVRKYSTSRVAVLTEKKIPKALG